MKRTDSIFLRHWRGQLPLGYAWWVNGVLLTACLVLAWTLARRFGWANGATFGLLLVALPLWQLTGLWRAADRHMHEAGTLLAGRLAQAGAALLMLLMFARAIDAGLTLLAARWPVLRAQAIVAVDDSGRRLAIDGVLEPGLARRVETELARHPGVRRIVINSELGSLPAALDLAGLIRARELETETSRACEGPCTLAYLAGRRRLLRAGARLGFRAFAAAERSAADPRQGDLAAELFRLRDAGVPQRFLARWMSATRQTWYPPLSLLRQAGIVHIVLAPGEAVPPDSAAQ